MPMAAVMRERRSRSNSKCESPSRSYAYGFILLGVESRVTVTPSGENVGLLPSSDVRARTPSQGLGLGLHHHFQSNLDVGHG
jgi:hypothetical protein